AASAALHLHPSFPPALFNQAEALDRLALTDQGRLAWRRLLELDGASGWAHEAGAALERRGGISEAEAWERTRRHLEQAAAAAEPDALAREVAAAAERFAQPLRLLGEENLLGEWAERRFQGDERGAAAALRFARAIGGVLAERHRDWMLHDSVAVLDAVTAGDARTVAKAHAARLAAGHRALRFARSLYERGDTGQAALWFARAKAQLAAGGSPLANWAELYEAICSYYVPDRPAALARLEQLERRLAGARFVTLEGRVQWMIGLILFDTGEWSRALAAYRAALLRFQSCHEAENEAAVENLVAITFDYLGDDESAWRHRLTALALLPRVLDPRRLVNIYGAAARSLAGFHPEAALYFAERNAAVAARGGNPQVATVAYWQRALVEHAVGDEASALADLVRSREQVSKVPDPSVRLQQSGDIDLAAGLVASAGSPAAALASLKRALDSYRGAGYLFGVPAILTQRARIYRALGDDSRAEATLLEGIAATETLTGQVSEESLRRSYVAHHLDIYDEMAHLQVVGRRDPGLGLAYAERRRAIQLLETYGAAGPAKGAHLLGAAALPSARVAGASAPAGLASAARCLEPGTVLVEYLVAGDALITFLVERDSAVQARFAEHEGAPLARLSSALLAAIERGGTGAELHGLLAELGERLLRRLSPTLDGARRIVFVPDRMLYAVPFAALVDPVHGDYLVERHRVAIALSAASCTPQGAGARASLALPGRVLLVGDPAFNPGLFPSLPRLPAARAEIAQLRRLYPQATVLVEAAATRGAFLAGLPRAELVHFSGHAVVHPELPARSALILADDAGGAPGAVFAPELAALTLAGTRLVVLAACNTGRGSLGQSDGVADLVRPFFAAGVPAVIATLWNVDDRAAARLSGALHRRLAAGLDAEAALRGAQLELLGGPEPDLRSPAAWAPFQLLGTAFPVIRPAERSPPRPEP
ncbi:MAG TPA: CHAT domain-containing protein, partial [Thermoanaerobaculia bacterium]|nr:CHAT domain-containing protein [Thermoanaerobaculia bacterium]